jgi:DNA (cytosine-5)-methyltransferase 1
MPDKGSYGKPRLLDLFCGAGGAGMGYHRAGFDVVGVDLEPQPNYPFEFHQADAMDFPLDGFDAIHASPPCQSFTAYRRKGHGVGDGYPDLIASVRDLAETSGLPWAIENVPGSSLAGPTQICGTGLGLDVQRHRWFEVNFPLMGVPCAHGRHAARFPAATNRGRNTRRTVEIGVWRIPLDVQQRAMGIDWMTLLELSEAIPPAYTEHIGAYLLAELTARNLNVA